MQLVSWVLKEQGIVTRRWVVGGRSLGQWLSQWQSLNFLTMNLLLNLWGPWWKKLAVLHDTAGCLLCRRALVPCLETVTFWLSVLKLRFYSYARVLDFLVWSSNFIAYMVFLIQRWSKFSITLKEFDKLKPLLRSYFFQHFCHVTEDSG